jgi:hypothetical protein
VGDIVLYRMWSCLLDRKVNLSIFDLTDNGICEHGHINEMGQVVIGNVRTRDDDRVSSKQPSEGGQGAECTVKHSKIADLGLLATIR